VLSLAGGGIQGTETPVTVRLHRAHAEFFGQSQGLLVREHRHISLMGNPPALPGDSQSLTICAGSPYGLWAALSHRGGGRARGRDNRSHSRLQHGLML
jgi:hypothetical protein